MKRIYNNKIKYKNMKKIILFSILSLIGLYTKAQSTQVQDTTLTEVNLDVLPEDGTYQIIITNDMVYVNITNSLLQTIEQSRNKYTWVYLVVNDYVKILVLPTNYINSDDFIPLETYKYEN